MAKPEMRTLRKSIEGTQIFQASGVPTLIHPVGSGWKVQANGMVTHQTYFDTSGYFEQDLTFFPQRTFIQVGTEDIVLATNYAWAWDIFSVKPITQDDLNKLDDPIANVFDFTLPGFIGSNHEMQDIVYGRARRWISGFSGTSPLVVIPLESINTWGTNAPGAGEKIYWTRVYRLLGEDNGTVVVQPCTAMISGVTVEEEDLEYIHRLARTYETQQD